MNHQLLSENIEKYVDSLDLKNKAFSVLDKIQREYKVNAELVDGYSIDEMIFKFERQEVILETEHKVSCIITRMGIYIKDVEKVWINNLKPIGYYDYEVALMGNSLTTIL